MQHHGSKCSTRSAKLLCILKKQVAIIRKPVWKTILGIGESPELQSRNLQLPGSCRAFAERAMKSKQASCKTMPRWRRSGSTLADTTRQLTILRQLKPLARGDSLVVLFATVLQCCFVFLLYRINSAVVETSSCVFVRSLHSGEAAPGCFMRGRFRLYKPPRCNRPCQKSTRKSTKSASQRRQHLCESHLFPYSPSWHGMASRHL